MQRLPVDFDPEIYLRLNPDVARAGVDATSHWLNHGHQEGRPYKFIPVSDADLQRLRESKLFDPDFYLDFYPDIAEAGLDPEEHYLSRGAKEGRWASYMFRTDWYADRYAEARADNPLFHFLDKGSAKGFHPNPYFETDFYLREYGDHLNGMEPLKHFILHGHEGFDPSPRFCSKTYVEQYKTGTTNPLLHYLSEGVGKGYGVSRSRPGQPRERVESAWIDRLIASQQAYHRNALLVTHSANGNIKPHVTRLSTALNESGYAVHLIVAADVRHVEVPSMLQFACKNVFVRENVGYDFAAWAHVVKTLPWLLEGDELLLTNDSICGPVRTDNLHKLTQEIRTSSCGLVGLTSNFEYAEHLQSYYLSLKSEALASPATRDFFREIVNLPEKSQVIREYEITLAPRLRSAGVSCGAIFPAHRHMRNPTVWDWDRLLDDGFPFVKMALISGEQSHCFSDRVIDRLFEERFPVPLVKHVETSLPPVPDMRMLFSKWPAPS
ncbi:rhamnan synthesis F family protein [Pelagibacterium luteolum]|uniref:Rhamnan synthesis protein F n=1 Tax=Pelagibacterium luteolum TaxID=440168 RepID=A0A1G7ZJ56_9HYPH|nr:rhamnan synthesis F family protein [Pelagibacterium luteolum]SDH08645.1 Rhamnan synthesis protein F [Pelagibacterium luteolum]